VSKGRKNNDEQRAHRDLPIETQKSPTKQYRGASKV
jgi:hypothetical protein